GRGGQEVSGGVGSHERGGDAAARYTPSGARQTGPATRRPAEGPGCCPEGWSPKTESGLQACYGKPPHTAGVFHISSVAADRVSGRLAARGSREAERGRGRQLLSGLEQRLETGEDHRPATVELAVGVFAELV